MIIFYILMIDKVRNC